MENGKCPVKGKCLSFWHELLGFVLLAIATYLTVITGNGLGIFAMFIGGVILCCCKSRTKCHCPCPCHSSHEEAMCCAPKNKTIL